MNNTFTKEHTQIAKGISILMMLYHHLFVIPERISCDYFPLITQDLQVTTAVFCKLCVCIFVFLSGYGIYFSLKKESSILKSYKNSTYRAFSFMINFIIIYLLFVPIGMALGYFNFNIIDIVLSFLGIGLVEYNNTWWFVNQYLVLLFIAPPIVYLFSKAKIYKKIASLFIVPLFCVFVELYLYFLGTNFLINNYYYYFKSIPVILTFIVGILCAKFNIYNLLLKPFYIIKNSIIRKISLTIFLLTLLATSIFLRVATTKEPTLMTYDFIVAPIFVFSTTTLIHKTKIKNLFILFGKHSTNMWLTHAFLCYTYLQPLVFLPYYSEVVFIWFVLLSLLTSYLVNLVSVPLNNLLFTKEHHLSYNGYFSFTKPTIKSKN